MQDRHPPLACPLGEREKSQGNSMLCLHKGHRGWHIYTPVFVYQSEEIKRRLKTASVMQQDCSQYTALRRKKIGTGKSKLKICPTQFFFSHECNVEISYYIFRLYVRNINSEIPRLSSPERSPPRSVCPSVVRFVSHPTSSNAIEDFHPI